MALLLGAAAAVDQADIFSTPLHRAAEKGFEKCVTQLLDAGAAIDKPDKNGNRTPLHLAAGNA